MNVTSKVGRYKSIVYEKGALLPPFDNVTEAHMASIAKGEKQVSTTLILLRHFL